MTVIFVCTDSAAGQTFEYSNYYSQTPSGYSVMTIGQSLGNEPMSTKGHDSIGVSGYNMKQLNVYIHYDVHLLVRRWEETSPSQRVVEGKWTALLQTNSTNRIQ